MARCWRATANQNRDHQRAAVWACWLLSLLWIVSPSTRQRAWTDAMVVVSFILCARANGSVIGRDPCLSCCQADKRATASGSGEMLLCDRRQRPFLGAHPLAPGTISYWIGLPGIGSGSARSSSTFEVIPSPIDVLLPFVNGLKGRKKPSNKGPPFCGILGFQHCGVFRRGVWVFLHTLHGAELLQPRQRRSPAAHGHLPFLRCLVSR